jgi:hypothetical protein
VEIQGPIIAEKSPADFSDMELLQKMGANFSPHPSGLSAAISNSQPRSLP